MSTLKWFSLNVPADVSRSDPKFLTYSGNLKVRGDIDIAGRLVREGKIIGESGKDSLPIGSIIRFPETSELPEGYLRTDGSSIGRFGDNELLWEVIGLDFEDPPGQPTSDTSFRLPDIEGHIIKYKIVNDVARESDSWNYSAGGITYFSPPEATVGIGMTNPNPLYSLDVAGSINFTGEILRNGVPFVGGGGNGGGGGWSTGLNRIYTATVLSEDITVSKVGIGISNPQSALHIVDVVENFDDFKGLTIGRPSSFTVFNHTSFTAGNDILYIQGVTRQNGVSSYNNNIILNPKGGNVGIGTTQSPVYLLDVNGDINLTGDILINGVPVLSAGPSSLPRWEVQGNNLFYSNGNVGIGTVGGINRLTVEGNINLTGDSREIRVNNEFLISTTSLANTIVDSSLTSVGTLTSLNVDGNVGLGTFVGINRLSVEGSVNLSGAGSSYRIGNITVLSNNTLGSSVINSSLRTTGYLTNLNVQGSVGIGTTNPVHKLDVFGDININGNILRNGSVFTGSGSWNETGNAVYSDVRVGINTSSPQSDLHVFGSIENFSRTSGIRIGTNETFGMMNMINSSNPHLLIQGASSGDEDVNISLNTQGGNVGIGVTDPKSRLHVLGTSQVDVEPGYLWRAVEAGIPSSDVVFIRYVEDEYYIGLQNGTMLSTEDFETFTPYILPADFLVKDIIFFDGFYFICGSSPSSQPKLYSSLDKSTWSPMLEISNELRSFATNKIPSFDQDSETVVVVGEDLIAYYPFVEPPPPPTTLIWNVTSNMDDTAYVFSGESSGENVSITVVQGTILEFNVNASGQPFWIKNFPSIGPEGGLETGVTNNGSEDDKVTLDTSQISIGEYYYISENVESMFGTITVNEEPRETLTWEVTNNMDNTAYVFSGESSGDNVSITVERGVILSFNISSPGQAFWIIRDLSIGIDSALSVEIGDNGIENGVLLFDTDNVEPGTYYYISENSESMVGIIIIMEDIETPSDWKILNVTGNWKKVIFGLNNYYSVGDEGALILSTDGKNWLPQVTDILDDLKTIVVANNNIIIGGKSGSIYVNAPELSLTIEKTIEVFVSLKNIDHPFFGIGSPNGYIFNTSLPIILERGKTYRFLQEDSSNSTPEAHPLYISSTPEGGDFENTAFSPETHNYQGTLGEVGAYLDYTVPFNAPDILYFACQVHSFMGRSFDISGEFVDSEFILRSSGVSSDIVDLVWNNLIKIYAAFTEDGQLLQSKDSIVWEPLIDIEDVTNVTAALWSSENLTYVVGGPDGQLTISDSSQSIFRTERTCVLVSGKLGVNTDAPNEALDVVGNAVVSGDLAVDTNVLFVNSTDNRVGVNTDSPTVELDILGKAKIESNTGYALEVIGDINFTGGLFQNDIPFVSGGGGGGGDVGDSLPIGAFVKYPWSAPIPEGYLKCDGAEVSRAEYDQLFAVLGEEYGAGDGSTTFLLPLFFDFIIKFRALGATATVDYMPIGSVLTLSWAIDPYPSGWLKCDGTDVSRTEYSQLFAAVGTDYGEGDGSTTFTLPFFFNQGIKYRTTVEAGTGDNAFWILNPDSSLYNITNVGVGTTNPTEKLTVEGNILVSGNVLPGADVTYDLGAPGSAFRDLYLSGSSIFLGNTKITSDPITGNVTFLDKDTNEVQNVVSENTQNITTDSGNTIITSGNVGIGVTNPVEKLVVAGDVRLGNVNIINSSLTEGNRNTRIFISEGLHVDGTEDKFGFSLLYRGENTTDPITGVVRDSFSILRHRDNADGEPTLSILRFNGNVGIGTADPVEKLHVMGTIAIENDGVTTPYLGFRSGPLNTNPWRIRANVNDVINNGLVFEEGETIHMSIRNGNVGIGTTNPDADLDVFKQISSDRSSFKVRLTPNNISGSAVATTRKQWYNDTFDTSIFRGGSGDILRTGFLFNEQERVSITKTGNVGIGLTNPSQKLVVAGDVRLGNVDIINSSLTGGDRNTRIYLREGDTDNFGFSLLYRGENSTDPITGVPDNNFSILRHDNNVAGEPTLSIRRSNGNVGIGTANPQQKLHVIGRMAIENGDGFTPQLNFRSGPNNVHPWRIRANTSDSVNGGLQFEEGETSHMVIRNGNVGIGTANPGSRLRIDGNPSTLTEKTVVRIQGASTGGDSVQQGMSLLTLVDQSTAQGNMKGIAFARSINANFVAGIQHSVLSGGGGNLDFYTSPAGQDNNLSMVMRLGGNGNVGIGTASPDTDLDIFKQSSSDRSSFKVSLTPNSISVGSVVATTRLQWYDDTFDTSIFRGVSSNILRTGFLFNNQERVSITQSGNVGIGLTNPTEKLQVAGNLRIGSATMPQPSGSAPLYAARAWVNFDGTLTSNNIRGSGNVSSVTINSVGVYTINFAQAMPNANYVVNCVGGDTSGRIVSLRDGSGTSNQTTNSVTIQSWRFDVDGGSINANRVHVSIFA
jgi:microcystin-dependent protein